MLTKISQSLAKLAKNLKFCRHKYSSSLYSKGNMVRPIKHLNKTRHFIFYKQFMYL